MPTISASDFQKRVGHFSDVARREPVTVTRQGRPSLVLLSAEAYERLKQIEQRATRAINVSRLPKRTINAMKTAKLSHLRDIAAGRPNRRSIFSMRGRAV